MGGTVCLFPSEVSTKSAGSGSNWTVWWDWRGGRSPSISPPFIVAGLMRLIGTVSLRLATSKSNVFGPRFITRDGPEYGGFLDDRTQSMRTRTRVEVFNVVGMYSEDRWYRGGLAWVIHTSCETLCIVAVIEVRGPRRRHQFSGEAKRSTKHKVVWRGAHFFIRRALKS